MARKDALCFSLTAALLLAGCATSVPQPIAPAALPTPTPCAADAGWSDPTTPRHIHGNTWYVGTCAISAILITSKQGHILIDGATDNAAASIEANIRALGLRIEDVRYFLNSHTHHDHAGGIAQLQHDSGATVIAREPAAVVFERGTPDRSDPQQLLLPAIATVANVRRIADGETLSLGPLHLQAHATPGHTPGGTSWTWTSCEAGTCRNVVYADSLTAISDDVYRYSDHADVLATFRQSLATVGTLPCDILLTPHPVASRMFERMTSGSGVALVDPTACKAYAERAAKTLDERIAKERSAKP
ncbi:subclass B3 metallo-beta-lactamase [Lysobacter fragariae]